MSGETARCTVLNALDELTALVERVLPMADEIDRRTADFTRRSLSRFRYLQDVTGERRTEIKTVFEKLNRLMSGKRISHHASELPDLPDFRLPAVKLPAGLDSLYSPPRRHTPGASAHAVSTPSTASDSLTEVVPISTGRRAAQQQRLERAAAARETQGTATLIMVMTEAEANETMQNRHRMVQFLPPIGIRIVECKSIKKSLNLLAFLKINKGLIS